MKSVEGSESAVDRGPTEGDRSVLTVPATEEGADGVLVLVCVAARRPIGADLDIRA